jgi:hypothetical protein
MNNALRIACSAYLLCVLAMSTGSYAWIGAGALCVAVLIFSVAKRQDEVVLPSLAVLLVLVSTQVQLDNFFSYAAATYVATLSIPAVMAMAIMPGMKKGTGRCHFKSLAVPLFVMGIVVTVFYVLITNELYRLYFFGSDTIFQIMVFAGLVTICFFAVYDLLR